MPLALIPPAPTNRPCPGRRTPARGVAVDLLIDRFMTRFIKVGGFGVITVVLGIFVFILWQVIPLFGAPGSRNSEECSARPSGLCVLGLDEYSELPFTIDADGQLSVVDLVGDRGSFTIDPGFPEPKKFTAFSFNQPRQDIAYATDDGQCSIVKLDYALVFADGQRRVEATAQAGPFIPLGRPGHPILQVGYGDGGDYKLMAAVQEVEGRTELHAASLVQERDLFGEGEIRINRTYDLSRLTEGTLDRVLVNRQADAIVACQPGRRGFLFRPGRRGIPAAPAVQALRRPAGPAHWIDALPVR
jgi:phosphate transport system permease protein